MFPQSSEPAFFNNDIIEIRRTRFGLMAYLINDIYIGQALAVYGEYSFAEYELFRQVIRPGQTVLDVGANLGAHTLAMAQLVGDRGHVYAFEPQPIVRDVLSMNMLLNQATHVQVYHTALTSQSQKLYMHKLDYTQQNNFGDMSATTQRNAVVVFGTRLDEYELAACDFIKIDVQGAEVEVLLGAQETIRRFRPLLYVENDRVETSTSLINTLLSFEYRLYWHFPPLFNPNNYFGNSQNLYPNVVSCNMICLPAEISVSIDLQQVTGPEDNFQLALARAAQARG